MRLALKVILATTLGMLAILIGFGHYRTQRQLASIEEDMSRDHRLIATTLRSCVARAWERNGAEWALSLVKAADSERPHLTIGWLGRADSQATVESRELGKSLVTRVPVVVEGQPVGAIQITERLDGRDDYVRASAVNAVAATATSIGLAVLVTLVCGVWMIGRPLDALIRKARRVGEGDLSGPLEFHQRDELGELANEMNAMCERLGAAQVRAREEATARIEALQQLRHADRLVTVGRLAAGIAHELGTPLNVIAGRTKLLRRGGAASEVLEESLGIVADQVDRMAAIIRQLLDFARHREPKRALTELGAIVGSTVRLMQPIARKRSVELCVEGEGSVVASVDRAQIEQVLSNLIVNAVDACSDGGKVKISCGALPARDGEPPAPFIRIEDDGRGMDEATQSRIFEPFFTTKDVGKGTGLGLSVAYGIVQEHGGALQVESTPNHGSTFTVRLPPP